MPVPALIDELFIKEYGQSPRALASAPGVVHLFGEQIEYAKGQTLGFAIAERVWVAVAPRQDHLVKMFSTQANDHKKCALASLKYKKEDRWANLLKGVLLGLDNLGCTISGVDFLVHGEVPLNKGLASSSALTVATSLALCEMYKFSLTDAQLVYVSYTAETQFMQRPSQVSSCFISFHAHAGACYHLDLRSLENRSLRITDGQHHFYFLDSSVVASGVQEDLREREALYLSIRPSLKQKTGYKDVRDIGIRELNQAISSMNEDKRRICQHIHSEELRINLAIDCVEATQFEALGRHMTRSHDSLRDVYDCSCPELDWIAKHAQNVPSYQGARMLGGGFGGGVVLLCQGKPEIIESQLKSFVEEYERIFGFKLPVRRILPSAGASVERIPDADSAG